MSLCEYISPWHIQEEKTEKLQRDLLSRESGARIGYSPPTSPYLELRASALRRRIMSDIKQTSATPLLKLTEEEGKKKLVPRMYRLFEDNEQSVSIKRFKSQKDIMISPRPANRVTIRIHVGKSKELKQMNFESRLKMRSLKSFYHSVQERPELKPGRIPKIKANPFALEVDSLKDQIECIFRHRGERLPAFKKAEHATERMNESAGLRNLTQTSTVAFQHVKNLRPTFSRNKLLRNDTHLERKFVRTPTNHYLDKLIGKLE